VLLLSWLLLKEWVARRDAGGGVVHPKLLMPSCSDSDRSTTMETGLLLLVLVLSAFPPSMGENGGDGTSTVLLVLFNMSNDARVESACGPTLSDCALMSQLPRFWSGGFGCFRASAADGGLLFMVVLVLLLKLFPGTRNECRGLVDAADADMAAAATSATVVMVV